MSLFVQVQQPHPQPFHLLTLIHQIIISQNPPPFHTNPHLSSAKLNLDLDSDNVSLSTSTAVASDALALARESLASAYEAGLSLCSGEGRNHDLGRDWRNGCLVRRRKRRKRRKGSEFESCDDDDKFYYWRYYMQHTEG